jgi:NCAIR mutase (PurE)-related protein
VSKLKNTLILKLKLGLYILLNCFSLLNFAAYQDMFKKILKSIQETRISKEKLLKTLKQKSHSGLKIHEKKNHTSVDTEKFPRVCHFCDKEMKKVIHIGRLIINVKNVILLGKVSLR